MTDFSREQPLVGVRWVRVGSVNEPKLAAVRSAIGAYAPDAKIEGVVVASGVSRATRSVSKKSFAVRTTAPPEP